MRALSNVGARDRPFGRRGRQARAQRDDHRDRVERRGRPRKEISRGDFEGVRAHLETLSTRFPDVCAIAGEGTRPREGSVGGRVSTADASAEAGTISGRRRRLTGDASVTPVMARVGSRRSVESRKKIARTQRERWRNARLADAAAAEARAEGANEGGAFAKETTESASKARTARMTKLIAMKKSNTRAEKIAASSVKVNQFSYELSAYNKLKSELASWSEGFEKAKGRKPTFKDVQNTRIPWLIDSFEEYVRLRNKLIAETPNIRGDVGKLAKQTLPSPRSVPSGGEFILSFDEGEDENDDGEGSSPFSIFNFR